MLARSGWTRSFLTILDTLCKFLYTDFAPEIKESVSELAKKWINRENNVTYLQLM